MLSVSSIIKRNGLVALGMFFVFSLSAQENSPFSRYGLGDIYPGQSVSSRAMAGLSAAYVSGQSINSSNPATYGELKYYGNGGLVTYDIGISIDARTLRDANSTAKYNSTNFMPSYIQFGLPLSRKNLGLVFGLKPVTRINYSVQQLSKADSMTMQDLYEGSGGLNQAFIGLGKKWKNLSIGFNTGYHFGKKDITTKVNLLSDSTNLHFQNSNSTATTSFNGLFIDGGIQYNIKLSEKVNPLDKTREIYGLRLGVAGNLQQKLNASTDNLNMTFAYNSDGSMTTIDTVSYVKNQTGTIEMPAAFNVGVMFTKSIASSILSDYQWMVGAEYSVANWSSDYRFYGQQDKVINSSMLRVGGQFTPNPLRATSMWERATYRVGVYSGKDFVNADGNELNVTGVTFGAGFHVRKFRSYDNQFTMINTALEIGKRGGSSNIVTENFFKVSVGLSLSDIWFIKKKYD